jgi:hypothetical protein
MALAKPTRPTSRFHRHFGSVPPGWARNGWIHWLKGEIERTRHRDADRCEYWLEQIDDDGE